MRVGSTISGAQVQVTLTLRTESFVRVTRRRTVEQILRGALIEVEDPHPWAVFPSLTGQRHIR